MRYTPRRHLNIASQEPKRESSSFDTTAENVVPSCEPLYEEIARLLDHASTTLDMATGILGEMAKGFSEEAETLRKLRG